MRRWRVSFALLLAVTLGVPLGWPLVALFDPVNWGDGDAAARLLTLGRNTALLVAGVWLLALPLGTALAVLLDRTDLPGRRLARWAFLFALVIPLPVLLTGWQPFLNLGGALLPGEWLPWSQGLGSAVWLHALAGLPWVVLLVGQGLRTVERDLEEDALTIRPAGWVLWHVSLRRASLSIAAAALWLFVQTAGEITLTDLMQVRTFAEEVYTQLATDTGADPLGRAAVASLGLMATAVLLVALLARRVDRLVPSSAVAYRPAVVVPLGRWRWPALVGVLAVLLLLVGGPLFGIVWRVGQSGEPGEWSPIGFARQLRQTLRGDGWLLVRSLRVALAAGLVCATVALVGCWLARESRWLRVGFVGLLLVAWTMPGPVLALGLKALIGHLLDVCDPVTDIPARLLWHGPSSLPLVIVYYVRFLPFAAALLWPAVRRIPDELFDAARLDGATGGRELWHLVAPLTRPAYLRATAAVAVLSLGEVSAGKLVSTPEAASFAEVIWTQMHYGLGGDLSAKCLFLVGLVAAGFGVGAIVPIRHEN